MQPVLIIQHTDEDPPAGIARALLLAGRPFAVRHVGRGEPLPASAAEFAAVIVLGGEMNTHQADEYPFLAAERALLRGCLREDLPLLGVCLGAQQLAAAAGGQVFRRSMPEIGWTPVWAAEGDPLLLGVSSPFWCLQWHDYSFSLPPGARRIASRPDGEQAFRLGRRAWGLQFHPEADEPMIERWLSQDRVRIDGLWPGRAARVAADGARLLPSYAQFCRRLIGNFLEAAGLALPSGDGHASSAVTAGSSCDAEGAYGAFPLST